MEGSGLTLVGAPMEVVRATDTRYLDQARSNFPDYVARTLMANMAMGGRYNPPGRFGALYCASDEETAWAEIDARFRREGIPGLPPVMGLLRIVITDGRYADLTDSSVVALWGFDRHALVSRHPDASQQAHCHDIGSAVRPLGDFLLAPSARADGENIPVFADRENGGLIWNLTAARAAAVPGDLAQRASESW